MANTSFPIDRRTRVARAARQRLQFAPPEKKVGRPCTVCAAVFRDHPRSADLRPLVTVLVRLGASDAEIHRQVQRLCAGWPEKDIPSASSIRRHVVNHVLGGGRLVRDVAMARVRKAYEAELLDSTPRGNATDGEVARRFGISS
jgi:hypothetical protein